MQSVVFQPPKITLIRILIVSLLLLITGCKAKTDDSVLGSKVTSYLGMDKEDVIKGFQENGIYFNDKTNPDERQFGKYVIDEIICGINCETELVFYQFDGWNSIKLCGININSKDTSSQSELNKLFNYFISEYGPVQEYINNIIVIDNETYELYEIADNSVNQAYENGSLFDLKVDLLQATWKTEEGGIVHFQYSSQDGIYIYEQSAETTREIGYQDFIKVEK